MFLSIAKLKPSKKMIYVFKNGNGVVLSWKDELKEACCKFYNKLYKAQKDFGREVELRSKIINAIFHMQ
jgi:hypothetical protein